VSNESLPPSASPGAVLVGAGPDAGVAAHYGDPSGEQRALASGDAVVDCSNRAVLSVTGPDRLTWIDSITSQDVRGLQPGRSSETLVLDANGRVEHAVGVVDDGMTLWLLVEASAAAPLLAWLERMRFLLRVEPADRTAEFARVGSLGDAGLPAASPNGVPLVWVDPWNRVAEGGWQYASADDHPAADWVWRETLVPRDALGSAVSGHRLAGALAAEALRIAAWRPRAGAEVDERTIPHELDWLRSAVHLSKGCYRGQETVAKVHNLGHPPRRLVMLHLDGSGDVLPAAGDAVELDGAPVGAVTSAGRHFEQGPIALAVLARRVDPGVQLVVRAGDEPVAAAQEVVVPTDAGAVAGVPRLPRLGAVTRTV